MYPFEKTVWTIPFARDGIVQHLPDARRKD
jgi:hypothetical protein